MSYQCTRCPSDESCRQSGACMLKVTLDAQNTLQEAFAPVKFTNPKDLVGATKTPTWVIPFRVLRGVGLAMLEGALKYGAYNWRAAGVQASIYLDAAEGHMGDFKEGESIDPTCDVHHIDKAIASLVILRDSIYEGNWIDDRPLKARGEMPRREDPRVQALMKRYPDPKPPFTEVSRDAISVRLAPKGCKADGVICGHPLCNCFIKES